MPNGTSERSALIEHCGVGGSVRKGTLYPITDSVHKLRTFGGEDSPSPQNQMLKEMLKN